MTATPIERIQRAHALITQAQHELDHVERAEVTVYTLAAVGCIQCKLALAVVRARRLMADLAPAARAQAGGAS